MMPDLWAATLFRHRRSGSSSGMDLVYWRTFFRIRFIHEASAHSVGVGLLFTCEDGQQRHALHEIVMPTLNQSKNPATNAISALTLKS